MKNKLLQVATFCMKVDRKCLINFFLNVTACGKVASLVKDRLQFYSSFYYYTCLQNNFLTLFIDFKTGTGNDWGMYTSSYSRLCFSKEPSIEASLQSTTQEKYPNGVMHWEAIAAIPRILQISTFRTLQTALSAVLITKHGLPEYCSAEWSQVLRH